MKLAKRITQMILSILLTFNVATAAELSLALNNIFSANTNQAYQDAAIQLAKVVIKLDEAGINAEQSFERVQDYTRDKIENGELNQQQIVQILNSVEPILKKTLEDENRERMQKEFSIIKKRTLTGAIILGLMTGGYAYGKM